MVSSAFGFLFSTSLLLVGQIPSPKIELVQPVQKIWDKGGHNAFTDLIRFQDKWVCVFREGKGHAAGAGTIRVLTSKDGQTWQAAALVEKKDVDLRDPHVSSTPDGRLMLVGGAAVPATRNPLKDHYSWVSFSKTGEDWTAPQQTIESWQWLWRVTWHKDQAFGVAYGWEPKGKAGPSKYKGSLWQSGDGLKFTKVVDFQPPQATEAKLCFDGDALYCLQRRDGIPSTALLGSSKVPYTEWTWKDLGMYFGGPNFLKTPDGSWWAGGRLIKQGKAKTWLCCLDLAQGKLQPAVELPSGGDTSYPGLVWHDNQLWMSYYSSHEGKTSIYLARFRLVI